MSLSAVIVCLNTLQLYVKEKGGIDRPTLSLRVELSAEYWP